MSTHLPVFPRTVRQAFLWDSDQEDSLGVVVITPFDMIRWYQIVGMRISILTALALGQSLQPSEHLASSLLLMFTS